LQQANPICSQGVRVWVWYVFWRLCWPTRELILNSANGNSYHIAPDRPMFTMRSLAIGLGALVWKRPGGVVHGIGGLVEKKVCGHQSETRCERELQDHQVEGCMISCKLPPITCCLTIGDKGVVTDFATKLDSLLFILGYPTPMRSLRCTSECLQALTAPDLRHVTPRLALKRLATFSPFLFQASS
jgi:hypothetical protein